MKIKYLKLKNWLLAALGGLLGINLAGCDDSNVPMSNEYGCPEATYHFKGIVTNTDGQPIEGIGVSKRYLYHDENSVPVFSYYDTTDADGRYSVDFRMFPGATFSLQLCDIDGDENGSYNDTVVGIKTDDVQLTGGDGHWYDGEGTVTQNVTMTEKTNK